MRLLREYLDDPANLRWTRRARSEDDASARRAVLTRRFFAQVDVDMRLARQSLVIEALTRDAHRYFSSAVAATIGLEDSSRLLHGLWQPFGLWLYASLVSGRGAMLWLAGDHTSSEEPCSKENVRRESSGQWPEAGVPTEDLHPVVGRIIGLLKLVLPPLDGGAKPASSRHAPPPRRAAASRRQRPADDGEPVVSDRNDGEQGVWWDPVREGLRRLIQVEGLGQYRTDRFWSNAFISSPVGRLLRVHGMAEVRLCEVKTIDRCRGRVPRPRLPSSDTSAGPASAPPQNCGHHHLFLHEPGCECASCHDPRNMVSRRLRWLVSTDIVGEYVQRFVCSHCSRLLDSAARCPECHHETRRADVFVAGELMELDAPIDPGENGCPVHETIAAVNTPLAPQPEVERLGRIVNRFVVRLLEQAEREIGHNGDSLQPTVNRVLLLLSLLPLLDDRHCVGLPDGWELELVLSMGKESSTEAIRRAELTCRCLGFQPPPAVGLRALSPGNYAQLKHRFIEGLRRELQPSHL